MGAAPAPNPALKTQASSEPSTAAKVENWTKKEWNAAKQKWSQDKAKWNACNQDTKDRRLSGRKNWSYLYAASYPGYVKTCLDEIHRKLSSLFWPHDGCGWPTISKRTGFLGQKFTDQILTDTAFLGGPNNGLETARENNL